MKTVRLYIFKFVHFLFVIVVINTTMTLVSDLSPYTNYTCSVFGHTRISRGPPITDIGLTDEDSECV